MPASTTEPKIGVKDAASIAMQYLQDLIPTVARNDISLEEVELEGQAWLVTLGFTDAHAKGFLRAMDSGRTYKQFRINAKTGLVSSMRMRKP